MKVITVKHREPNEQLITREFHSWKKVTEHLFILEKIGIKRVIIEINKINNVL